MIGTYVFYHTMLHWHGICFHRVFTCLSLSQTGVVQKWLKIGSHNQCHTITQGFKFSDVTDLIDISMASPQRGHQIQVVYVKIGHFWPILCYISETVQDRDIVTNLSCKAVSTRMRSIEWCYFCWPWVTPNYDKLSHFPHFVSSFISV